MCRNAPHADYAVHLIATASSCANNRHSPRPISLRLQAPVSGSKKPAIDGQLIILAAGDEALFGECEAAFSAMVSCAATATMRV
jgi:hypothetical protein